MHILVIVCIFFGVLIAEVNAQTMPYGYAGRRFIIGFMQNELITDPNNPDKDLIQVIGIATTELTNVQVENYLTKELRSYVLAKDSVTWIAVPRANENFDSEVGRMKGIEIRSDRPITVQCLSSIKLTSEAYLAMPVLHWGKEYAVVSMPNTTWSFDPLVRTGEFLIIGAEDNTLVTYTTTAKTDKDTSIGKPVYITLNKGETYLVRSTSKEESGNDLTGTFIRSDKPIGVLSGHIRTCVPTEIFGLNQDSRNHLVEMLVPTSLWSNHYVSVPFTIPSADPDIFKVIAYEPNTTINVKGKITNTSFTLDEPGSFQTIGPFSEPLTWTSSKPFSLTHFMPTSQDLRNSGYDPAMVIVPAVSTYMQEATFRAFYYPKGMFRTHHITITCDSLARDSLRFNGKLIRELYPSIMNNQIPDTRYYFINFRLTEGTHKLTTKRGRFTGTVYGLHDDDAYAFSLGGELIPSTRKESIPPTIYANNECGFVNGYAKEPAPNEGSYLRDVRVALDSTVNYSWKIDPISDTSTFVTFRAQPINPSKNGVFIIDAIDNMGNTRRYRSVFKPLDIEFVDTVRYTVSVGKKECRIITLKNTGKTGITIGGGTLVNDSRVSFGPSNPNGVINQILVPGKSVNIEICFDPGKDTNNLHALFQMKLPCNLIMTTVLIGRNIYPELSSIHHDFDKVVIGDTVCSKVHFISKGNIPIIITKVHFSQFTEFTVDTTGLFPITLYTGDTLSIPVCYQPDERLSDSLTITPIHNQADLPNIFATAKGKGIAPLVLTNNYSFPARRIGTISQDTLIEIANIGNMKADIVLISKRGDTLTFKENTRILFPATIQENDTLRFSTSFLPDSVRLHGSEIQWKITNWKLHQQVSTTLSGEGTLPTITTHNYEFDTVKIHQSKVDTVLIFNTGGNEQLTIDTILWGNGDIAAFSFDAIFSQKQIHLPGKEIKIPITFAPKKTGKSSATLYITHDALPGFKRKQDTIIISGYGVRADTINASFDAVVPMVVTACTDTLIPLSVLNTGNVSILIDSLRFASSIVNYTTFRNTILDSGVILRDTIKNVTIPYNGLSFEMTFSANNASIFEKESGFIQGKQQNQNISIMSDTSTVAIGTVQKVLYSGILTLKDKINLGKLTLYFSHDPDVFHFMNNTEADIFLLQNSIKMKYTVPIIEEQYGKYSLELPQNIISGSDVLWELPLEYMALLSTKKSAQFSAIIQNHPLYCIENDSTHFTLSLLPVCADDMRAISFTPAPIFRIYQIRPHPVSENSEIFMVLPDNAQLHFDIIDVVGVVQYSFSAEGSKGFNTIQLHTKSLDEGYFTLRARSMYGVQTIPFIIQK